MIRYVALYMILTALLAVLFIRPVSAREPVSYTEAHDGYQLGQPMVVVLSASWCPHCHDLINELKPTEISFTVVDVDRQAEFAAGLCDLKPNQSIGPIPKIVVWRANSGPKPVHYFGVGNIHADGVRALLRGN